MLRGGAKPGAELRSDDQRRLDPAAEHVAQLGRLVHDLVEADPEEIIEHQFRHRPQPGDRGPGGRADERRLADRCVQNPVRAILSEQALGDAHHAAPGVLLPAGFLAAGNILADQHDARIARHLVIDCFVDGLAE